MLHDLYKSVDELLAPATLTALTGQSVNYVRCLPMPGGNSGAQLLVIEANGGATTARYILKQMARPDDWILLASDDRHCRSVALWQSGLLDRLRPTIDHAIIACSRDGEGWAMLMRDVSAGLTVGRANTAGEIYALLDALAALHATFWEAAELSDPNLGLCDAIDLLQIFSPETGRRFPSTSSPLPQWLVEGWSLLQEMVAPDVADVLCNLYADPQPLCTALARYPFTLVHGDYRNTNFSILDQNGSQVALLDWQVAGRSAATIDLAWFLGMPSSQLAPLSTQMAIDYYRKQLAQRLGRRFDEGCWQPLLALGLLVDVLRMGCFHAWFILHEPDEARVVAHRRVLATYDEQVRAALQWL